MPLGMRSSVSRYSGKVSHVQSMPCGHGVGRDVLGPLEVAHDEVALVGPGRGEREAAVAHDHAGHAVPARAGAERVPQHLGVHVGVAVDEAGRDDVALGVDLVGAPLADAADGGDAARGARRHRPGSGAAPSRRRRRRCGSPGRTAPFGPQACRETPTVPLVGGRGALPASRGAPPRFRAWIGPPPPRRRYRRRGRRRRARTRAAARPGSRLGPGSRLAGQIALTEVGGRRKLFSRRNVYGCTTSPTR